MISHSKKGITLVELIVAMTLTSIFAVLCVMLINPIERTYKSTLKLARAQLLADTLVDSIRKEVDDVKHDDTTDVWIADLSGADDSQLINDTPSDNKKTSGNTLVFRRNNNYTEAIYAAVGISKNNQDAVAANPLTPTNTAHSIDTLINSGKENLEPGIVHFGYYQAKEDDSGVFPIQPYDYTNPVMAKTYGEFTVKLNFSDLTLKSSKYPAYVMCKVTVLSNGKEFYSRLAVLCFAANGSGKGSGSHHTNPPSVRDIEVNVVWDDDGSTEKRPENGLDFTLRNDNSTVLGSHTIPDVRSSDAQRFVFKNINTKNGFGMAITPDTIPEYECIVKKTANGYLVTYTRTIDVMLISGPSFYEILRTHNRGTITSVIFDKSTPANLELVKNAYYKCDAAINKKTNASSDEYKLYLVKHADNTQTLYVLTNSANGRFNGNPIMGTMFMDCTGVTQFSGLDLINTADTIDMHRTFYNCRNIRTTVFKVNWNTKNVQSMDGMFRNFACGYTYTEEVSIDVSSFDFDNCQEYKIVEGHDDQNVISINKMFNCDGKSGESRLVKITFKPGYKKAKNVGMLQQVFDGCKKLRTIENFDNFDFSGLTEFLNVFKDCSSITELNMSNWNLSSLKNLGPYKRTNPFNGKQENILTIFNGLSNMTKINLNGVNLSSATNLKETFKNFTNLEKVYMTGAQTCNEKWTMEAFFRGCTSLNTVEMTGSINSHCSNLKEVFYDCDSLTEMDISGWTTSGVENMASMFYSSGVRKVTFPSANGSFSSATDISSMFQNCVDLTTVENFILNTDSESTAAAPSVSLPALTNANSLFGGCVGLKNVKFKLSAPVLEKLNQVFSNCDNLVCADLSGSNFSKLNNANQMFNSCGALTKVILNNVNMSSFTGKFVNAQGNTQDCVPFNDCSNLKHLEMRSIILTSVPNLSSFVRTTIEHFDMSGATVTGITSLEKLFASKTNLNYVDISNVTWGSYTSAKWMFSGCENLQTINVTGFKAPSNCTEMFINCYNSTNLDLSGMDTEAVEIMDGMFKNCRSFAGFDSTAWEGTGWTTKNVKSMTQMFMDCCTTTGPDVSVGTYTINISNFDFSKVESFKEMFNCDKKTGKDLACTIILPSGTLAEAKAATVTTNRMFRNRKNLTSLVNIDQFYVENNHTDSGSMFANTGLTTINIRRLDLNKVSSNAQYMFNECSKLTTIYVNPDLATNNTFTTKFSGTTMFEGCSTNLVGEDGTRWANNKNVWSGKYARIGSGYFTPAPTPPPEDPNP